MLFPRPHRGIRTVFPAASLSLALLLAACSGGPDSPAAPGAGPSETPASEYRIVTLLPRDAIPAIDDPEFYAVAEADEEYSPTELVLGVSINGDSRAYPVGLLSSHEIVNDTVGGQKIAVTW